MLKEQVLQNIGFSKNQSRVYLAVLKAGNATAGEISAKSGVHRTNVYDALDNLIEQGLVAYIHKGAKKLFMPTNPENIRETLKEKERMFNEILPELRSNFTEEARSEARIYEGVQGVKAITDIFLRVKKEVDAFGIPATAAEDLKTFIGVFHKRRIKEKIRMRHIYDENASKRIRQLNKMPYTEAVYFSNQGTDSPATTLICGNFIAFVIWSEKPLSILIKSEKMAMAYKQYFEILWKISKKD